MHDDFNPGNKHQNEHGAGARWGGPGACARWEQGQDMSRGQMGGTGGQTGVGYRWGGWGGDRQEQGPDEEV